LLIRTSVGEVTVPLSDVVTIELERVPLQDFSNGSQSKLITSTLSPTSLPADFVVWVIDGDSRFSAGTYHSRDCVRLGGHTPRGVRFGDLAPKPKPIPDDCVQRLLEGNKGKDAVTIEELVRRSASPPNTRREPSYGITSVAFSLLETGMTYEQVRFTIGSNGELMSSSEVAGMKSEMYVWRDYVDGGSISVMFQDGRFISK